MWQTAFWKSLIHQTSYPAYLPKAFILNKGEIKLILVKWKSEFIVDRCALEEMWKESFQAEMKGVREQLNSTQRHKEHLERQLPKQIAKDS